MNTELPYEVEYAFSGERCGARVDSAPTPPCYEASDARRSLGLHRGHRATRGSDRHAQGLALQQALERQAALSAGARWHRRPAVRGVQEGRAGGAFRARRSPAAGVVVDRHRNRAQGRPRAARLRCHRSAGHEAASIDHAQEHGVRCSSITGISGCARRASVSCASAPVPAAVFRQPRVHVLFDAPIITPSACEGRRRCSRRPTSTKPPTSRRAASCTARPARSRSARCTCSGRPSVPRSRRRAAI